MALGAWYSSPRSMSPANLCGVHLIFRCIGGNVVDSARDRYWKAEQARSRWKEEKRNTSGAVVASALLLGFDLHQRLVDQFRTLVERTDGDALVIAVHAAQIVGGDWIWIDAIDRDASLSPCHGVGTSLK